MAEQETIKSFLISLGWENNEREQKKFEGSVTAATTKAILLAKALEELAIKAGESLRKTAEHFEMLYFQSKYLGAAASNVRALGWAFENMGGSAAQARSAIANIAQRLQEDPATRALLKGNLFGGINPDQDPVKVLAAVGRAIEAQKDPVLKRTMREMMGLDFNTSKILQESKELEKQQEKRHKILRAWGLDEAEVYKKQAEFMERLREVYEHFSAAGDVVMANFSTSIFGTLEGLSDFMKEHGPEISHFVETLATDLHSFLTSTRWKPLGDEIQAIATVVDGAAEAFGGWARVIEGMVAAKIFMKLAGGIAAWRMAFGGAAAAATAAGGGGLLAGGLAAIGIAGLAYGAYKLFKGNGKDGEGNLLGALTSILIDGAPVSMSNPLPVFLVGALGLGGGSDDSSSGAGRGVGGSSGAGGGSGASGGGPGSSTRGAGGANYMGGALPGADDFTNIRSPSGETLKVNKESAPAFSGFLDELAAAGAPLGHIGSYAQRNIAGSSRWSQHAYGNALDLGNQSGRDVVSPQFRRWVEDHPKEWAAALKHWNIVNGGAWRNPDFGHVEWGGPGGTPAPTGGGPGSTRPRETTPTGGGPGSVGHAWSKMVGSFDILGPGFDKVNPANVVEKVESVFHESVKKMGWGELFWGWGKFLGTTAKGAVSEIVDASNDAIFSNGVHGMMGLRAATPPSWAGTLGPSWNGAHIGGEDDYSSHHHYNMPMSVKISGVKDPKAAADLVNSHFDDALRNKFLERPLS